MSLWRPFQAIGGSCLRGCGRLGHATLFLAAAVASLFSSPLRPRRVLAQIHFIGARSLPVILLTALFTGMVLGLQGYYSLRKFGAEPLLGPAVALGLIRELGPVLSAVMVIARAGSATAAELGVMRISEQIDALEVMAVSPLGLLVAPRLCAAALCFPLLCSIFDVVGIFGGYLVGVKLLDVSSGTFFSSMRRAVELSDVSGGLWKALSFGLLTAFICTYKGFHATKGAEGVGRATTDAVVLSSVAVLVWDYFLTSVLFR